MTAREQAKAALEESLGHGYSSLDNLLNALVDAVEPIIRADERVRVANAMHGLSTDGAGWVLLRDVWATITRLSAGR